MQEEQGNTTTTPGDSRSPSFTSMEESIPIEPLTDDDDDVLLADNDNDGGSSSRHDTTSDYDSGEEETRFGSVTSSVGGHVWEYGRYDYDHLLTDQLPSLFFYMSALRRYLLLIF